MSDITSTLEKFILDVVHLNNAASYSLLDNIKYEVTDDYLNEKNDPYLYKKSDELIDKMFIATNINILSILWDKKIPHTVKELLLIAGRDKKNYFFWRKPITVITKFLQSIEAEQLQEVGKLRSIIANHNQNAGKADSVIWLKKQCDRYIENLMDFYFLMKKHTENEKPDYAYEIFKAAQRETEEFVKEVDSCLNTIESDDLKENWLSINYVFKDFINFNKASEVLES